MSRTPPAWPRPDGAGAAFAPTSRSPSGPPSRVAARPQRARVRLPSSAPPWGRSTGHRRTAASQAARATAPEARGAARSARCRSADASHPGHPDLSRCSGRAVARSSAARSSSPPRRPRSCDPALTTRSPESASSRSDPGPTGASLPDRPRSDDQQPAPWLASAPHGAPAYPLRDRTGIHAESFARTPYDTRGAGRLPRTRPAAAHPLATARRDPGAEEGPAALLDRQGRATPPGAGPHRGAPCLAGGEASELQVEPAVHALDALSRGAEMQARLLELARQGVADAAIADMLTREGHRSARCSYVPVRTVQIVRQRYRVLRGASRTHPRHLPGWLTIAELARQLRVSRSWIDRRIRDGTIAIRRDVAAKHYLFPDTEDSRAALQKLKSGEAHHLDFAPSANQ